MNQVNETKISKVNVVYLSGKEGYHFASAYNNFGPDKLYNTLVKIIRKDNPELPFGEVVTKAAYAFNTQLEVVSGSKLFQQVHSHLKEDQSVDKVRQHAISVIA